MTNTTHTNMPDHTTGADAIRGDRLMTLDSIIDETLARSLGPLLGMDGFEGDYDTSSRFGSARIDHLVDRIMLALTALTPDAADEETGEEWNRMLVALAFTDTYTARGDLLSHRGVPTITAWEGYDTFVSPLPDVVDWFTPAALDLFESLAAEREPAMVDWNLMTFFLTPEGVENGQPVVRTRVVPYREMNPVYRICDTTSMVHLLGGDLLLPG